MEKDINLCFIILLLFLVIIPIPAETGNACKGAQVPDSLAHSTCLKRAKEKEKRF